MPTPGPSSQHLPSTDGLSSEGSFSVPPAQAAVSRLQLLVRVHKSRAISRSSVLQKNFSAKERYESIEEVQPPAAFEHRIDIDFPRVIWKNPQHIYTGECLMPHFLHQIAYSREGWQAIVNNPQDRIEAVRPAVEKLGGRIETAWFAFGDYDVVVITEMPNNLSAAAIAIAFSAGGACKAVQTTPLLSTTEAVEA
jgi:uncharacterized protein with GYD domain